MMNTKKEIHLSEALFAVRTGLEPATPGVTGRYSNQLNYRTIVQTICPFSKGIQRYNFFLNCKLSGRQIYEKGAIKMIFHGNPLAILLNQSKSLYL